MLIGHAHIFAACPSKEVTMALDWRVGERGGCVRVCTHLEWHFRHGEQRTGEEGAGGGSNATDAWCSYRDLVDILE